ncbi:MAG: ABC transporter permease [Acidobacteria bacterium]|nr:ABC transporter permease [Acidobacteriota bacterium]
MFLDLVRDFVHGASVLRKSPGFAFVAMTTLALGIGVNTALFSVVNGLLFEPLPVERPGELVGVYNRAHEGIATHTPLAFPDYRDIRDGTKSLTGMFGYALEPLALETGGSNTVVMSETATGDYFTTLGVRAALGRTFTAADEEGAGAAPVVVLSHAAWQRRFAGDPGILGRTLRLNGSLFTVIGIAPREFTGLYRMISPDVWIPMRWTTGRRLSDLEGRGSRWMMAMARLKPASTLAGARAEAATVGKRLQREYPDTNRTREVDLLPANSVTIVPGMESVLYPVSFVLLAGVGLVLLIASANVANMLLARAAARRREFAVRLALGAPRGRIVRQLLVESLLLAIGGAAGGLLLGAWSHSALLAAMRSLELPFPITLTLGAPLDGRVLAYTLGLALVTTLAFGLAPALESSRPGLVEGLKGESGGGGARPRRRLQSALVVAQVAFSLVLLIGAGLSLRSLLNAHRIDPGFRTRGVVSAGFSPTLRGYSSERSRAYYDQLLARVRALPGVTSAAVTSHLPLSFQVRTTDARPEGAPAPADGEENEVDVATAGPGYFETMEIRVVRGRSFMESDVTAATRTAIVNESLARAFWPGEDPIGRGIVVGREAERWEVIGVVRDAKYRTLGESPRSCLYQGYGAASFGDETLIAAAPGDPAPLEAAVRDVARAIDEKMPVMSLQTLEEATSVSLLLPRAGAWIFMLFGLLGSSIAVVGLYGLIAYLASRRTREIGIRMALGARPADILRLVISQGLKVTLVGVALGLAGAFAATRAIGAILYGISPTDTLTYLAVATIFPLTAAAACYLPARRAAAIQPTSALRCE